MSKTRTDHKEHASANDLPGAVIGELSTYMAAARAMPLPPAVVAKTKADVLDTLAAIVSGTRLPAGLKAIQFAAAQGGASEASIPGTNLVVSTIVAATAAGMAARADETDDSHGPSLSHPGCGREPKTLHPSPRKSSSALPYHRQARSN